MGDISEHFSTYEITCQCGCGHMIVNPLMLYRLELVRSFALFPMQINSWCRCVEHNKAVGGVDDSEHITGEGVDIAYKSMTELLCYLFALPLFGFQRVIVYPGRIHVGIQVSKDIPYFNIKTGVEEWLKTNY